MTFRTAAVAASALALTLGGAAPAALAEPASGPRPAPPSACRTTDGGVVGLPVGLRPEGVESGPGDTFFVGSLADGRILTGDLRRGTCRTLLDGVTGRQLRGLFRDARSGLLWAAGQDGSTGIVLAVDTRSGAVRARIEVAGAQFLNDLVVTRDAVWVTDSRVAALTRIALDRAGRPTGATAQVPLADPWPQPAGTAIGANGIRALPGGTLVLDNSTAGGLWTVDPRTGAVAPLPLTGTPAVTGGDGLELLGSTLYVVRGSGQAEVTVVRLRRDGRGWRGEVTGRLTSPALDVPATATVAAGRLWAVNARFGVPDPAAVPYAIVPLPLRPAG